jgi:AraC family transcriptional regulator, regulatory protein of adaptative response / DNA-3-methyladenine glycosylase II
MVARSNPPPDAGFYAAFAAHDARFDGRVFVGVTSTGVYCRPVCRVRTPIARNCRFFANAASAEHAGFRPCLRCRPELAPGLSLVDSSEVLAHHAARTIEQAAREGQAMAMPQIAQRLGVTDRHLRRVFAQVHGVSPIDYLTTQRLLLAKQLLTDTTLPVTQVALASGFGSLRRFNAAFVQRYRLQPTSLRKQRDAAGAPGAMPTLRLAWRPPYDVAGVLRFFADRQLSGVEHVSGLGLRRTIALHHQGERRAGWLSARWMPERNEVALCVAPSLTPAVGVLLQAARQAFDLDADPQRIDPVLATLPGPPAAGMRVPNGFDGWETAVRVVLGQQVTVAAARTLVQRLVQRFGEPITTPFAELNRLFPTAGVIAQADAEAIGTLGIVRQRVRALQALATEVYEGRITLNRAAPLQATLDALRALPGIGEWTAQLVAMRALAWPDAFPASDIGMLNALHTRDPAEAARRAEAWRPWRAYAVIALWQTLVPSEPLLIKEAA